MTEMDTATFYVRADRDGDEPQSERMARWESARDQGAAYSALVMLRCAVWLAQDTLSDTEVHEAIDDAMNARYPAQHLQRGA